MADTLMEAIALYLKNCLCTATEAQDNPPANCCYRLAGDVAFDASITQDLCCEGLAYVSFGDNWPSADSFPETDIIRQARSQCAPPSWGVSFKIGIIRCSPVGTDVSMPTCEDWTAAAMQAMADAKSLRTAACCFRDGYTTIDPQLDGMSVVIGRQTANTPQGGCVERSMTIDVQVPSVCDGC